MALPAVEVADVVNDDSNFFFEAESLLLVEVCAPPDVDTTTPEPRSVDVPVEPEVDPAGVVISESPEATFSAGAAPSLVTDPWPGCNAESVPAFTLPSGSLAVPGAEPVDSADDEAGEVLPDSVGSAHATAAP